MFNRAVFTNNQNEYVSCIREVMGMPRALPDAYCKIMRRFGTKAWAPNAKKFMLLEGELGCGRTTLAQEFAKETSSCFIVVKK